MTSKCASCGAVIRWVKTLHGRNMPLDTEPSAYGTFTVEGEECSWVGEMLVDPAIPRYRSHFATCPNAEGHRKGRKKGGDG